jgi:hypothetical protein
VALSPRSWRFESVESGAWTTRFDGDGRLKLGWWSPAAEAQVELQAHVIHGGAEVEDPTLAWLGVSAPADGAAWAGSARLDVHPRTFFAPNLVFQGGWSPDLPDWLAFRVGGLTPYAANFGGTAWGEFWLDSFWTARFGLEVGDPRAWPGTGAGSRSVTPPTDTRLRVRGLVAMDVLRFSSDAEWCGTGDFEGCVQVERGGYGVVAGVNARIQKWWLQGQFGYSLVDPSRPAHPPAAMLVRTGVDWVSIGRKQKKAP